MHLERDSLTQRGEKGAWRASYHAVYDDGSRSKRFHVTLPDSTGASRREAHIAAGEVRSIIERDLQQEQRLSAGCGITLLELYTEMAEENLRQGFIIEKTAKNYIRSIASLGRIAETDLSQITPELFKKTIIEMLEKGYAKNTVAARMKMVKSAMSYAVDEGILARNPVKRLKVPSREPTRARSLTTQEIEKLSSLSAEMVGYMPVAIALGLGMGLRGEEVCALRWSDRNVVDGRYELTVNYAATDMDGETKLKTPKTPSSLRCLPEPEAVTEALNKRMEWQRQRCAECHVPFSEGFFVLGDIDGKPINPHRHSTAFSKLCSSRGLKCNFHWLRHTFASLMVKKGVNPILIAKWLGHSSHSFTVDTYCDAGPMSFEDSLWAAGEITKEFLPRKGRVE